MQIYFNSLLRSYLPRVTILLGFQNPELFHKQLCLRKHCRWSRKSYQLWWNKTFHPLTAIEKNMHTTIKVKEFTHMTSGLWDSVEEKITEKSLLCNELMWEAFFKRESAVLDSHITDNSGWMSYLIRKALALLCIT